MTTDRYPIPAGQAQIELVILRSRFISTASYTPTVQEAKSFIAQISRQHAKASHNVYAFAVGYGASVTHGMSDQGEPSGTAGRPTLAVVKGSGLGDVTVVTTRYFGGTKLGTGGLVKAYTESAQLALAEIPRTVKVELRTVTFGLPYNLFERVKLLVAKHDGEIESEEFGVAVALRVTFPRPNLEAFAADLAELSAGRVSLDLDG